MPAWHFAAEVLWCVMSGGGESGPFAPQARHPRSAGLQPRQSWDRHHGALVRDGCGAACSSSDSRSGSHGFPSEGPLNEARHTVGIALPDLIRGPLTQEKIDNAEGAIGVWMVELLQR
jgi:hypothetical protein